MRSIIGLTILILSLVGCSMPKDPEPPIMRFYRQAKQRQQNFDPNQSILLAGLRFNYGVLPGSGGEGTFEQSSLVVTDHDFRETQAVQVIVEPRVSGSYIDQAEPSPELRQEQARNSENALKTHLYIAVFLLPKPTVEQDKVDQTR